MASWTACESRIARLCGSRASGSWSEATAPGRQQLQALQQRFALVESRAVLETCRRDVQAQRDALVVRLGQAQSRPPASIERELARVDRELAQLTQEMRTQGHATSTSSWQALCHPLNWRR